MKLHTVKIATHLTEVYDKVNLVEVEVEGTMRSHAFHTALAPH